jgi:hypothetical protein
MYPEISGQAPCTGKSGGKMDMKSVWKGHGHEIRRHEDGSNGSFGSCYGSPDIETLNYSMLKASTITYQKTPRSRAAF